MKKIKELYKYFIESDGASTDTRQDVRNKIFFALSGENFDGNKFADIAHNNGALVCVIDNPDYNKSDSYFLVDNVLETLQLLANYHRKKHNATILAITGSNGKTTTKELVFIVLGETKSIIATQGNLNNHIGVPLTLLRITNETEIAVVEMGANHIGEIDQLCEIALPHIGIITNIGKAHLEGFGSFQGVITAKNELYNFIKKTGGHLIVNADDSLLTELSNGSSKLTYGKNNADIEGEIVDIHPNLHVKWGYKGSVKQCHTQLYGNYNFYNIMAAIATGIYFDIDPETINSSIENYVSDNNRSQLLKTKSNKIILDAYNANPFSMMEAITSFADCGFDNPWLLLGDMFELGDYAADEHQKIVDQLIDKKFANVLLIGKEFSRLSKHSFLNFETTSDAGSYIKNNPICDADILIKGSRGMRLEELLEVL